ncbi:MAG TPA: RNA polymerase sigma factor [Candidatus Sulfotelmatobacter sp.]|nr:RNA polymerase sigma factor [Candidatus Sulfotelmatobacter sp.]
MDNLENCSDPDLLRWAMAGDESAFVALYDRLKNGIFRYAFYMTNSRAAAEEVTQEVFIALLKEGGSYRESRGDVGAFAFGIARNYVRRIERRERPYQPLEEEGGSEEGPRRLEFPVDSLTGQLIQSERTAQVQAAIASLPDHYRQAVVLCDLCELSYEDAASRLKCAVGTIRSRLNRAHALLAQKLKPLQDRPSGVQATGTEGCLI